jgi:hypothetical protein
LKDAEMADDLYERVEKRAYEIWELEGRPDGAAQRHWDQAMDELAGDDEHETLQDLIDQDDLRDEERAPRPMSSRLRPTGTEHCPREPKSKEVATCDERTRPFSRLAQQQATK